MNERRQYEVLLPFMHHAIYDGFGRDPANDQALMDVSFYQEQTFIR